MIDDDDLRRMREEAEIGATLSDFETLSLLDELEKMRAENARLRESLNEFLNDERFQVGGGGNPNVQELLSRLSPPMFEHEWRRLNPNQRRWLLLLLRLTQ